GYEKGVAQGTQITVHCGSGPVLVGQLVAVLGNAARGDIRKQTVPKLPTPPAELLALLSAGLWSFFRENIAAVAVNQVGQRMALGFRSREVSALKDGSLSDLNPFASVREFGEGGRERRCSLASNLDTVNLLAVLAWSSDDGSHVLCLPGGGVTLLEKRRADCPPYAPWHKREPGKPRQSRR